MRQTISLNSQPLATGLASEEKIKEAEGEKAAVIRVIKALLDAVPSKDAAKMLAHCLPTGSAARMRGGEVQVETLAELCGGIQDLQGEVWEGFVEPEVRVCGFFFPLGVFLTGLTGEGGCTISAG